MEHNSLVKQLKSKKKASTKSYTKWADDMGKKEKEENLTQMKTLRPRQKRKAHIREIPVGDVPAQDEVTQTIYRMGAGYAMKDGKLAMKNAVTGYNWADKSITPMGGFPTYGEIKQCFVLLKDSHTRKRAL